MPPAKKTKKERINQNYIFVQAFVLYQKAIAEEKNSYVRALNLFKQALSLIDSIIEKFPDTALALKIAQRRFRLGRNSYSGIQKKIRELRVNASREEMLEIMHDCACSIQMPEMRADKLSDIALLFFSSGQLEHCQRCFSEASLAAEVIDDSNNRSRALNRLALKYAEAGEYEKALTLSIFFSDLTDQIRLLTDLGCSFYQKKLREKARQLFVNAIDMVDRDPDPEKRTAGISWIAYKLADSEEFFWALEVTEGLEDEELKFSVINQIAERLIASGKLNNLQEMIIRVPHPMVKAELTVSLAMKYGADGYFSQAREIADRIDYIELKARAYIGIAQECKEKAHQQHATDMIREAAVMIQKVPGQDARIHLLTMAAGVLHKLKQESQVKELLMVAFNTVMKITEAEKRSEFLAFLVKTSMNYDQLAITDEMFAAISERDSRDRTIVEIAVRHAIIDNFSMATHKLAEVSDLRLRIGGYFKIISNNPENRNFRRKILLLEKAMHEIRTLPAGSETDRLLSECAILFARLEKFHNALQILETINDAAVRDDLLCKLAELKFKGDFFVEGIEILRLISNQDVRLSNLIGLGVALFKGSYPTATYTAADFLPTAFAFWLEEKEKLAAPVS